MISQRQLFLDHVAQTSDAPLMLEVERAEGIYIYDPNGKKYIDLIAGVSVSNTGHRHPKVVEAVKKQADAYMHTMVYGEHIQGPQAEFAKLLTDNLPHPLDNVYFVNSGSEATEGAMKLAKRYTGRQEILAFRNAYHGSTHGALSVMGNEEFKKSFRPLVPGIDFLEVDDYKSLEKISTDTACVIIEPVQGEAGVVRPQNEFIKALSDKCREKGALLIFDEIQTGFGRTGTLFAFQQTEVIPDIILFAKGVGGGMPIGVFVSSKEIMSSFMTDPVLGHITTFGGHPVSCAAAKASLGAILDEDLVSGVSEKGELFRELLKHEKIKKIQGSGLFLAVDLGDADKVKNLMLVLLDRGVLVDWFLFQDKAFRIAPPLIISKQQIREACSIILQALDEV